MDNDHLDEIAPRADVAVVLRTLRDHTEMTVNDLLSFVGRDLSEQTSLDVLIVALNESKLIAPHGETFRLSEAGHLWLSEFSAELNVENEDPTLSSEVSGEGPRKPYEVSKLKMEAKQISVFQALRKIEKGEINLNPEFQRAFVWDEVKQSRLIESVLIRIPLPVFYLDATDRVRWSVVDGLQRLTTLYNFCRKKPFKLTGLQFLTELENCTFSELPPEYRVQIEDDTQLLLYNLMPGTPVQAKFTIFSRVNTGGMQLTAQEIRHALNQGKITDLLAKLAKSSAFLTATSGVVESLRMSDRELILRALAFLRFGFELYKEFGDQDGFLLHAMSELNKESNETLDALTLNFTQCLTKVHSTFGRYAFRKFTEIDGRRSPFNKALFEVWVVSVKPYTAADLSKRRTEIMQAFVDLINSSPIFVRSISSGTGNYSAVATRFNGIQALLAEVMK